MHKKLTFQEYLSLYDTDTGWIDEDWKLHWQDTLPTVFDDKEIVHHGDCTKDCCPCHLCVLESMLEDYRKYYFDEDEYDMKDKIEEHYKGELQ